MYNVTRSKGIVLLSLPKKLLKQHLVATAHMVDVDVAWTVLQRIGHRTAVPDPSPWSLPRRLISTRQSRRTIPLPGLQLGISASFVPPFRWLTKCFQANQRTRDVDTTDNLQQPRLFQTSIWATTRNSYAIGGPKADMSGLTWGCWS